MNYKSTLNLPTTDFPMKANLAQKEPETLRFWEKINLYQQLRTLRKNAPRFTLPDGPPYANGPIHIGHAVNKTLKDIILKIKTLNGFNAPFIPGWDCHGLPIESNVEKKIGKPSASLSAQDFREACRAYATEQVEIQKKGFQRLGVLGDWAHPYLTMAYTNEANIVRTLKNLVQGHYLYQGKKPVHWCLECASALAEAEVEYKDKQSHAIDVAFQFLNLEKLKKILQTKEDLQHVIIPIWTTTPWTLPANQAVAVHPEATYLLLKDNVTKKYFVLAESLSETTLMRYGITSHTICHTFKGQLLENLQLHHPFYERSVPIVLGEHVTLDTGTGAVHTAPVHGVDDFALGQRYQLSLDNPVDTRGCYTAQTALFAGQHIKKSDQLIIDLLKEKGNLLHHTHIQHSFPHCWRHKTPLIFMTTPQWFINMQAQQLREKTLNAIPNVVWIPAWGQTRMTNMIIHRPDWCISRQRYWGVPLTLIIHKETKAFHPRLPELIDEIANHIERDGIEAWHTLSLEKLIPGEAEHYEKINDILDVWYESGVVHTTVPKTHTDLVFPADVYIEGSDQHRGWFQSSLLTSVAFYHQAPFKTLVTHGFTIDLQGNKMSKSVGNVIAPDKVIESLGADVLRLWIASADFSGDLTVSDEILKRTADTYRKLRNTLRFLLANLHDFKPEDALPLDQLLALDAFMLDRGHLLQKEVLHFYDQYQFYLACQHLHRFCTIDLSSFYLDIIKDRQYTCPAHSRARRSAQTVMYHFAEMLVRLYAPILSFTAEEVWRYLPGHRTESVFLSEQYLCPKRTTASFIPDTSWEEIIKLRELVNKESEKLRVAGKIGSNLDAEIKLYCSPELYKALAYLKNELRFAFITSQATLHALADKPKNAVETEIPDLFLEVFPSTQAKCERCWHHRPDIGTDPQHLSLCARCVENLGEKGEERYFA
ncbi:MAG: isoleucine--tRNA ligase [Gammaproteobacteria bacterium RIFCSPHIGHO2_02_FULL_38_33]|nr:MAG: isoleucine--tRNA ligase [Gammaproteobacteria bacterium RIFCSPHIGHO2_02_FULL_38_33]